MTTYSNLNDEQLLSVTKEHLNKFNRAWQVVMANHYSSGIYIDAENRMEEHYKILGDLDRYIYRERPWSVYEAFKFLSNY